MRFALKAACSESLFLAAYYSDSKEAVWTRELDDAGSYSTLERVISVLNTIDKELEIIPVRC